MTDEIVLVVEPETVVVEVGVPGPPGPPGTESFDADLALLYQIAKL